MPLSERAGYVCEKLRTAVLTMMTDRAMPKDRLMMTVLTNVASLKGDDFPEGELRLAFSYMMKRIHAGASPATPAVGSYEAAFRYLSDDDVRWLIDRLHSLAFSMARYFTKPRFSVPTSSISPRRDTRVPGVLATAGVAMPDLDAMGVDGPRCWRDVVRCTLTQTTRNRDGLQRA